MLIRAVLTWIPMVGIAVANGLLREALLNHYLEERPARQVSTLLLLSFFALYIGWVSARWPLATPQEAVITGLIWLVLTLLFEFGLGRAGGQSWKAMLEEYNLLAGKIWVLVPLWVAIAPYFFFRLRQ